jgi:hypothetical protein
MSVDINSYRMWVGMYYSKSCRLPLKKLLDFDSYIFILLYIIFYGGTAVTLFLLIGDLKLEGSVLMPSKSDKQSTMVTEESYQHTCSKQHGSKNQLCINLLLHLVILAILLFLSGDIEINQGPPTSSVNSSNASSFR